MEKMMPHARMVLAGVAAAMLLGVGGCRDAEQRPTHFTPGIYGGTPVPPLSTDQVKQLETRGNLQR